MRIQNPFIQELYNIEGLFIESWSASPGYSTEMLTEGAQSWWVLAAYYEIE